MGWYALRFFLVTGVIFAAMLALRAWLKSRNLRPSVPRERAPGLPTYVPPVAPPAQGLPTAGAGLPAAPVGHSRPAAPPAAPAAPVSPALAASRDQAVLLRQDFPPRPGALSHWGGVPLAPPGFTWPFVMLPNGPDRALTFILQLDCASVPERGRLGLLPDRGQLYFFLDLDWGNHWRWSVRFEDGDPHGFVPARVPSSLPRAYSHRATWGWPQHDADWPSLLPEWSIQPLLLEGDGALAGDPDDDSDERDYWPGTLDLARALGEVEGAVVPLRYYQNQYDADGVLVRPYATFPHDWQAVRIAMGHLERKQHDRRHLDPYVARGTLTEPQAAAFMETLRDGVRRWSARASTEDPWAPVPQEERDAVWRLFLDYQPVALFALGDAVNDSVDATLSGNPAAATLLPPEALEDARVRHAPASTGEHGLHVKDTERMLCAPSYVQGDAEQRIGEWLLLLEMSSEPSIGHHFGEGVYQFWIRPEDLAARRFDRVELTASAY